MSVIAHVDPDGVRDPCVVSADGSGTVGVLLPALHAALGLERPCEEWEVFHVDTNGAEQALHECEAETRLEDVGIFGSKEVLVVRLAKRYVNQQLLRARGIDGEAAACLKWRELFRSAADEVDGEMAPVLAGPEPLSGDGQALAKLIAGSGWARGPCRPGALPASGTALHYAALEPERLGASAEAVLRLLMENGADVGSLDGDFNTPLHCAVHSESVAAVRLLLEYGAEPAALDGRGQSPLHRAAQFGSLGAMRTLLERGADVDIRSAGWTFQIPFARGPPGCAEQWTPLHVAALENQVDAMRVLLDSGAAVDAQERQGCSPLHIAASQGALEAMRLLVERGACVDARHNAGRTPLHVACASRELHAAKFLVRRGADVAAQDGRGKTPLHLAAATAAPATVQMLLARGAPPGMKDAQGKTALGYVGLCGPGGAVAGQHVRELLEAALKATRKRPRGDEGDRVGAKRRALV